MMKNIIDFHSALAPTVELGAHWPPAGIDALNPFEIPLLNTVILLSSGATVTYAHHSLIQGNRKGVLLGIILTVILAIIFTGLQGLEYYEAPFTLSDGRYGSTFFFATGFHGLTLDPCHDDVRDTCFYQDNRADCRKYSQPFALFHYQ